MRYTVITCKDEACHYCNDDLKECIDWCNFSSRIYGVNGCVVDCCGKVVYELEKEKKVNWKREGF